MLKYHLATHKVMLTLEPLDDIDAPQIRIKL